MLAALIAVVMIIGAGSLGNAIKARFAAIKESKESAITAYCMAAGGQPVATAVPEIMPRLATLANGDQVGAFTNPDGVTCVVISPPPAP